MEWITQPEAWIALGTLVALEIVLGIDNVIFISILVGRLPPEQRRMGRYLGLGFAMLTRLALLFSIVWIMGLVSPWFSVFGHELSGRDIILVVGGMFLIAKSTHEIHTSLELVQDQDSPPKPGRFMAVMLQIALLDIVFSLDSIITAVGMVQDVWIMTTAIVISVIVMMVSSQSIGQFVDRNPTIKMLALSFLLLIGFTLIAEGFDAHVPKGYIYFAMAFSVGVELLNLRLRRKKESRAMMLNKKLNASEPASD